ncbi:hypothetical protein N8Z91_01885 [Ascidiaceihabitans sp.]|nr:hypothetical protein [Ascidiaceihabitans sp.]
MRATSQDYVGTQAFGDVTADGRKQGFFGSHCFLIKSPLWESKAFQSFWAQYRVSLTYRLYSAGISDAQKRKLVDGVRVPEV